MAQPIDECCDDPHLGKVVQARALLVDDQAAEALANTFKALADPTRVRIVSALNQMELCVGDLAEALGMSMSAVSHQLRLLRDLRLVKKRRDGKHIYYQLDDEHISTIFSCGLDHISEDELC